MNERVCPGCGEAPGAGTFCGSCGLNLSDVEQLPTRAEWQSTSENAVEALGPRDAAKLSRRKLQVAECLEVGRSPGLGYVLSVLLPGLGHFYFELLESGVAFLFALGLFVVGGYLVGGTVVGLIAYLLVWLAALIDLHVLITDDEQSKIGWG